MKEYILNLDKPRELRFGFKALRRIREKFGDKSLDELMNIKVDEIPVLVLNGLIWNEKDLTLDQVEDMLDDVIPKKYTIIGVTTLTLEALAAQMGVDVKKTLADNQEEKEKKQATKRIPSTKKRRKQH